jgi:uncharacterized protein YgiB involved in biofilm formation
MSKLLTGFILGTVLMAGISYAQTVWQGNDSSGNSTIIYDQGQGAYSWSNSQGQSGHIYQQPAPQYRSPC